MQRNVAGCYKCFTEIKWRLDLAPAAWSIIVRMYANKFSIYRSMCALQKKWDHSHLELQNLRLWRSLEKWLPKCHIDRNWSWDEAKMILKHSLSHEAQLCSWYVCVGLRLVLVTRIFILNWMVWGLGMYGLGQWKGALTRISDLEGDEWKDGIRFIFRKKLHQPPHRNVRIGYIFIHDEPNVESPHR